MPPYETSLIMGNLLSGGLILNEFDYYTRGQIFMIVIGTLICIFGIFFKVLRVEMVSDNTKKFTVKNIMGKDKVLFGQKNGEIEQNNSVDQESEMMQSHDGEQIKFKDVIE